MEEVAKTSTRSTHPKRSTRRPFIFTYIEATWKYCSKTPINKAFSNVLYKRTDLASIKDIFKTTLTIFVHGILILSMRKTLTVLSIIVLLSLAISVYLHNSEVLEDDSFFYVLDYHNVAPENSIPKNIRTQITPANFEKELEYLVTHGYAIAPLEEIYSICKSYGYLKTKMVAITFDDGLKNQMTYALPILKEYKIKATFYIPSQRLDSPGFMSKSDVSELLHEGMFLGGHTSSHVDLETIKNPITLTEEITNDKKRIETLFPVTLQSFAYPFNSTSTLAEAVIKKSGYLLARNSHFAKNTCKTDPYNTGSYVVSENYTSFLEKIK